MNKPYLILLTMWLCPVLIAGEIPHERIFSDREVLYSLDGENPNLAKIIELRDSGKESEAIIQLIQHSKRHIADRFYFNWNNFNQRFKYYGNTFPDAMTRHEKLSEYHKSRYAAETAWVLPFKNLLNEDVTAYELRHLARQQKSADMTMMYFSGSESENRDYFVRQVADLNRAFEAGEYDDEGNGVYEVFRAGKRIHNWLFCHNAYLSDSAYDARDQMLLIRTFLHHGAQLYKRTKKNRYGNHHTRGLVALFEIAALFPEFSDAKKWKAQAIAGLTWHISNEINDDGFQFERSVHYHKGDIENYFRVYQLARINNIDLPDAYVRQFRRMFESLILLAQPNRKLPVLQDDTDKPFAENNHMDDAMTIGAIVFEDSLFRYFSTNKIPGSIFWLLRKNQLSKLGEIGRKNPKTGSAELANTGYYISRSGWHTDDMYLTVSAGLSDKKPDHQHGDMLGVVAYANGREVLPNYQVRYKYSDYIFWKNSWVKNVALVDSIPLGRRWKANRGKSGFGKWLYLPEPKVISWIKSDNYDYFSGSHSGYDSINVKYSREVIALHQKLWIICDHFESQKPHTYQQVWQGKYIATSGNTLKKSFADNTGLMIRQLPPADYTIEFGNMRDKYNAVISVSGKANFSFITALEPYNNNPAATGESSAACMTSSQWFIRDSLPNLETNARLILSNYDRIILINSTYFNYAGIRVKLDLPATFVLDTGVKTPQVMYLGRRDAGILEWDDNKIIKQNKRDNLTPGETFLLKL